VEDGQHVLRSAGLQTAKRPDVPVPSNSPSRLCGCRMRLVSGCNICSCRFTYQKRPSGSFRIPAGLFAHSRCERWKACKFANLHKSQNREPHHAAKPATYKLTPNYTATQNYKLQTTNCKLQTANYKLQTANYKPQTAKPATYKLTPNYTATQNCKLQTANCKLQTANCKLQTANSKIVNRTILQNLQPTNLHQNTATQNYKLQTAPTCNTTNCNLQNLQAAISPNNHEVTSAACSQRCYGSWTNTS
jgi:hypothetical protein